MYHSEEVRRLAPEMDPLRLGMGWKLEDLEKPRSLSRAPLETAIREARIC